MHLLSPNNKSLHSQATPNIKPIDKNSPIDQPLTQAQIIRVSKEENLSAKANGQAKDQK